MQPDNKPPMIVRNSNGIGTFGAGALVILFGPAFVDMTLEIVGGVLVSSYSPEYLGWAVLAYRVAMYAVLFYSIRSMIATTILSWSIKAALRMGQRSGGGHE